MPVSSPHPTRHRRRVPRPRRLNAARRRRQILEVATLLFSRYGFQGTTTRRIAEQARVNEALIFRHFPSKEELYWAVLDSNCRGRAHRELRRRLAESGDSRAVLTSIAEDILSRNVTLNRLLWFSALENHRLSGRFFQTYVAKYYEELAAYLRRRIQQGEFRRVDPLLAARAFIGMVAYHFQVQELFGAKRYQRFDRRHVAETLTDIWLTGMACARLSHNGDHSNGRAGRN